MSGDDTPSASGKPSPGGRFGGTNRWLFLALGLSLALNAFVLGAVVGERWRGDRHYHASHHGHHGFRHGRIPGHSIRHFAAMLDGDTRRKLRQAARPHKARMKLLLADAAEARLDALDILTAPEFDAEALEAAFARSRKAEAAAAELTQSIIAEAAARFSPEERAVIHKALQQRMELWRERVERRRRRLERWQRRMEREGQGGESR